METEFPKVLVFGEAFKNLSGPGMTLTSLFSGWPADKIADMHMSKNRNNQVTENHIFLPTISEYFQLFKKEDLIPLLGEPKQVTSKVSLSPIGSVRSLFRTLLFRIAYNRIVLSNEIWKEVDHFNPQVLYVQPCFETIPAILRLHDRLNRPPLIVHIMDDWPGMWMSSTNYLTRRFCSCLNRGFTDLLLRASRRMAIGESMATEYMNRYNLPFTHYQRVVDVNNCSLMIEKSVAHLNTTVQIRYIGRIGIAVSSILISIAQAVKHLREQDFNIEFSIVTPQKDTADSLGLIDYVDEDGPYPSSEIPRIISESDILLIPLDFTEDSLRFSRYSMPSKVPEYLISGVPILVVAHPDTALAKYATEYKWGIVVNTPSITKISEGIRTLLLDKAKRSDLVKNALECAMEKHSSISIKPAFQAEIIDSWISSHS